MSAPINNSGRIAIVIEGAWRSRRKEEPMAVRNQDSFSRAQAKHWPKEDLAPYVGRWVAIRDGKVIASDLNLSALQSQAQVKPSDVFMPVPRTRAGFFIA
jgi:hypothetical protein